MRERKMGMVGYRMPDGRTQYIRRADQLAALYEGADTQRGRVLLEASECLSGGRLHELAQSLIDGPTVQHQPLHPEKETVQ